MPSETRLKFKESTMFECPIAFFYWAVCLIRVVLESFANCEIDRMSKSSKERFPSPFPDLENRPIGDCLGAS